MYLEVENTEGLKIGDKVLIKLEPSNLKISSIIYGLPILFFVTGVLAGLFLFHNDLYGFFVGVSFLILSILPIKVFSKRNKVNITKTMLTSSEKQKTVKI